MVVVRRSCIEIPDDTAVPEGDRRRLEPAVSLPLAAFRGIPSYVLLADPGAGKTTAFHMEKEEIGSEAVLVSARDFLALDPSSRPEWWESTLFIDGLDEVRSGASDKRTPFDQIRSRLDQLGKPRFRISCREADWLGENDRAHLAAISQDGRVKTLRLEPLNDSDVETILGGRFDEEKVSEFLAQAEAHSVTALLYNPQTLGLLADVFEQEGHWPESRLELFQRACRLMVQESNTEHRLGNSRHSPDEFLRWAGQLCAVALISGRAGLSLNDMEDSQRHVPLGLFDEEGQSGASAALASRLFRAHEEGLFVPVHRHIAEFLAARSLATLIGEGLPLARVLALLSGGDGMVVTELRGLSAWLASLSVGSRGRLIEQDPYGVALYGDISQFSRLEKQRLLSAVSRETSRPNGPMWGTAETFKSLAIPEMASTFLAYLSEPSSAREHQLFLVFLLDILLAGGPVPGLSEALFQLVRDETCFPAVRRRAAQVLVEAHSDQPDIQDRLRALLDDVADGRVADEENELLGTLLGGLFPQSVAPSEIWDYLRAEPNRYYLGSFQLFWAKTIVDRACEKEDQLAALLDCLFERQDELRVPFARHHVLGLPGSLLVKGLELLGEKQSPRRIFNWLRSCSFDGTLSAEETQGSRMWLEGHPVVQKALILEALADDTVDGEVVWGAWIQLLLQGAEPPVDLGSWCLEQAQVAQSSRVAHGLLSLAVNALIKEKGCQSLSLELLLEGTSARPDLQDALTSLLRCEIPDKHLEQRRLALERKARTTERMEGKWLADMRSHLPLLQENRAPLPVLFELGKAYIYHRMTFDELLGGDHVLIQAALTSLVGSIERSDLPEVDEIIEIAANSRMHLASLPVLAGMSEMGSTVPPKLGKLEPDQLRTALAIHFCHPVGQDNVEWYLRCVEAAPEMVADILVRCARAAIAAGEKYVPGASRLAHQENHAEVARLVGLTLLKSYPLRGPVDQLHNLDSLLHAAARYADRSEFLDLIRQRLSRKSMTAAQRVHWLAFGAVLSSDKYLDELAGFVGRHQGRARQLAEAICGNGRTLLLSEGGLDAQAPSQRISVLELVIRVLGRIYGPVELSRDYESPDFNIQWAIHRLIQELGTRPEAVASATLRGLMADKSLGQWHLYLEEVQRKQEVLRRDATYVHPEPNEVIETMTNAAPANAGDLAALVVDRIEKLGETVRHGNTDDWRQYWNEGSHRRVGDPKHEESCRDAFLSDLRGLLPPGVDGQPEGQHSGRNRSDIRVSFRDFFIPVEIKKNNHRELWSAARRQLIEKYTGEPETAGYGIYLVFWFGVERTPPPAKGVRPASPEELQRKLEADLTDSEKRKISVRVLDVSPPG